MGDGTDQHLSYQQSWGALGLVAKGMTSRVWFTQLEIDLNLVWHMAVLKCTASLLPRAKAHEQESLGSLVTDLRRKLLPPFSNQQARKNSTFSEGPIQEAKKV